MASEVRAPRCVSECVANISGKGNGPYVDTSDFPETNVPPKIPGKTGGGCVSEGPFVNMTVTFGPGPNLTPNPRCLRRDFAPSLAIAKLSAEEANWVLSATTYGEFDHRLQGIGGEPEGMTIHAGGHLGVGGDIGDIGNMYSSPGDPLFFLHHANLDRLWNQWQRAHWGQRKKAFEGPDTMFAYPWEFYGEVPYKNITSDFVLDFKGLLGSTKTVKVSDLLDIGSSNLCIQYK